jgi:transcriptional regulator
VPLFGDIGMPRSLPPKLGFQLMYVTNDYHLDDAKEAAAFVTAHPFAVLARNGAHAPVVAHVPLVGVCDGQGILIELIGHVARANPFHEGIGADGTDVVAIFRGEDAYVSPSFYPSKAQHGKVVPTWNYLAAEARGLLTIETDPVKMEPYLVPLTQQMESHRPVPWAVSDAPKTYLDAMYRGILGLRIAVTSLTAKRKLSQNKTEADFNGVVEALEASQAPQDQAIATQMKKESRHVS